MSSDGKTVRQTGGATRLSSPPQATGLGLRERNKLDKLERISTAAINLFAREGYERATLRDIAREADVALGTVALYARDKRDLIMMIFNRVVPPLLDQGRRNTSPSATLADNMVEFFKPFYWAYADQVLLYRTVLGQIFNGPSSAHADESSAIRVELINCLSELILRAAHQGELQRDFNLETQARSFFYLYFAAVRVWLADDIPDPNSGLADLRKVFAAHVAGLAKAPRPGLEQERRGEVDIAKPPH